jgi:hypothetical protein
LDEWIWLVYYHGSSLPINYMSITPTPCCFRLRQTSRTCIPTRFARSGMMGCMRSERRVGGGPGPSGETGMDLTIPPHSCRCTSVRRCSATRVYQSLAYLATKVGSTGVTVGLKDLIGWKEELRGYRSIRGALLCFDPDLRNIVVIYCRDHAPS